MQNPIYYVKTLYTVVKIHCKFHKGESLVFIVISTQNRVWQTVNIKYILGV